MSCWVVPSVAAELWGISVNQVIERVNAGEMPSRTELGWLMVDIAPGSHPQQSIHQPPPATFVTVARPCEARREIMALASANDDDDAEEAEEADASLNDSELFSSDWRQHRMSISLTRRRPAA